MVFYWNFELRVYDVMYFILLFWYLVYLIIVNLIEVVEILVIRKLFLLILISIDYKYFVIFGEDKCNRMLY